MTRIIMVRIKSKFGFLNQDNFVFHVPATRAPDIRSLPQATTTTVLEFLNDKHRLQHPLAATMIYSLNLLTPLFRTQTTYRVIEY